MNKNRGKFGQFLPIFKKRSFPKWENGEFLIFKTSRLNFFSTSKQNSSLNVTIILEMNILDQNSVVKDYLTTASDENSWKEQENSFIKDYLITESMGKKIQSILINNFQI
ncbi:MAG: hypothetical protein IPJ26_07360 [Bacteroidetes bacterium]|nr:hypothetical protein [Bacteroidota bacterium]